MFDLSVAHLHDKVMTEGDTRLKNVLRRRSGVALWRQIAEEIRFGLAAGLVDAAGKLPGEMALAARFNVNRHTVRSALKSLADEGVVETRHGDGTYVISTPRIIYPLGRRTRFSDGVGAQARSKRGVLLESLTEEADRHLATALGVNVGAPLVRLQTLSEADGIPLALSSSWFDAVRFSEMAKIYRDCGSITESLRRQGVDDYVRRSTTVEARHASETETDRLGLSAGAIVLVTKAINTDRDGVPVEYSISQFPADRVSLTVQSDRDWF